MFQDYHITGALLLYQDNKGPVVVSVTDIKEKYVVVFTSANQLRMFAKLMKLEEFTIKLINDGCEFCDSIFENHARVMCDPTVHRGLIIKWTEVYQSLEYACRTAVGNRVFFVGTYGNKKASNHGESVTGEGVCLQYQEPQIVVLLDNCEQICVIPTQIYKIKILPPLKQWPNNVIALVSGRVGDPFCVPKEDHQILQCWNCAEDIRVSENFRSLLNSHEYQKICVQCYARYQETGMILLPQFQS